jgi:hypothetical protein
MKKATRLHRHVKRRADVALSRQVVNFVWLHFDKNRNQAVDIEDIAIVHVKLQGSRSSICATCVIFLIQTVHEKMLDATLIEGGCVALDAVNFVSLRNGISNVAVRENRSKFKSCGR